jgi:signal transduction histidine kinase
MLLTTEGRQDHAPSTGDPVDEHGRLADDQLTGAVLLAAAGREMASSLDYRATLRRVVEQGVATVADDGPGIAPADHARVFGRFHRADPTANSPGTGLALPIARAMVELRGGRVELESAPGTGATFRIILPRGGGSLRQEEQP